MKDSITWWEKTVEYKYIIDYVDYNEFISPLDGKHERAGDAILSFEDQFLLIEFKRDEDYQYSERIKYTDFNRAKRELQSSDHAHFVVYGFEENKNLHLAAQTYFSGNRVALKEMKKRGTCLKDFTEYVQALVSFKKKDRKDGTSSGGFSSVTVIQYSDVESKCMSFEEFSIDFNIELRLDPPSISGPSMSM